MVEDSQIVEQDAGEVMVIYMLSQLQALPGGRLALLLSSLAGP